MSTDRPYTRQCLGQSPVESLVEPLGEKVERLAALHATGALRCESGAVYLEAGIVVHAESELATGLDTLLTRCGRIPPDAWRASLSAFGREHRVGRMLVEQGQLTQGELELCHLGALHDAAFFTLGARSPAASFEPGVRHWLGPVSRVSARLLRRETVRRRDLLERIWPCPQLDSAPVVPALSATGCRSRTTPRQRELLRHADGRRTPADLARLLGRSAFSTTVEVRRLAALGVVATPPTEPPTEPLHESAAVPLQRRTPGAALRRRADSPDPQRAAAHPLFADNPDIALLTRVRNALEARL